MSATERTASTKTVAAIIVVVAFVSGALIGAAGDRIYLVATHRLSPRNATGPLAHRIAARLDRELKLTPQQRTSVEQILLQHGKRIDAIWGSVRPQVRGEIDQANVEIERLLTPQQREKFAKFRMRMERHARSSELRPPNSD